MQMRNAADELDAIRRAITGAPGVETRLIAGAGHFYTGHETNVAQTLAA